MRRALLIRSLILVSLAIGLLALATAGIPILSFLAKIAFGFVALVATLWAAVRFYQAILWKVGRRLAFSYFLIGVVPIPLLAFLALGTAYVLSTFFLGHVYRTTLTATVNELLDEANDQLDRFVATGRPGDAEHGSYVFDYYRAGKRLGGSGLATSSWPAWMTAGPPAAEGREDLPARFVSLGAGTVTLAVAVESGELGVIATFDGRLGEQLSKRSGAWVTFQPDENREESQEAVTIQGTTVRFGSGPKNEATDALASTERAAFFAAQGRGHPIWDRPVIFWPQLMGPLMGLGDGQPVSREVLATANATPRTLMRELLARKSEYNKALWLALGSVAAGLSLLYSVALVIALAMIFGLSRAVNRLSKATAELQAGNFSARIPVQRRDQIGALQRSFNQMSESLEGLIASAAQKEILEKELAIARELQESLIPSDLPQGDGIELATVFEPSAAIGGDYFDILRLDSHRLAVFIADVSGHGLSAGLRMAMIKAALLVLCDEKEEPEGILGRLDRLLRSHGGDRFFVTATLAILDLERGELKLLNAGHPPTYLLRRGEVREITLPGCPLGTLDRTYGQLTVGLEADDVLVWLSDGLIEATDAAGEVFGYERITAALAGQASSAAVVRDRLMAALGRFAGDSGASDDRTLVVVRYGAPAATGSAGGA